MQKILDVFFKLRERGTTVRTEALAGLTTFLTMAYIIFVNPAILADGTGMPFQPLVTATILASVAGSLLSGLWANLPFAMAPGMGLNAMFTYMLVHQHGLPWQQALGVVFLSGVFFMVLTLVGMREKVVAAIPLGLRLSIAAGIGLLISLIGLQNLGLVVANKATLVGLGQLNVPVVLGLLGLVLMAVLEIWRVRGAVLIGILAVTFAAILLQTLGWCPGLVHAPTALVSSPANIAELAFKLDPWAVLRLSLLGAIFSFMFVDLFDSVGSIVACSYQAGMVREDGSIAGVDRLLQADAAATIAGTMLGVSTTTTYIESGSGIAVGGRTGLTAVFTALCFLLALPFTPLVGAVPSFATAPALVMVGAYMFRNIRAIDFSDLTVGVPAFVTIVLTPLTCSISTGLGFGFLAYILINLGGGYGRRIHPVMWVIGLLAFLDLLVRARG
ncbi:MAG: NCS2 family permease [Kiritimatiellia bacterium]